MPEFAHYPDIAAAGDLRTALQDALDAQDLTLRSVHPASPGWRRVGAEVRAGDRCATVDMASDERLFLLNCWMQGLGMAKGNTADLGEVAAAIAIFVSGAPLRRLTAARPFVRTWAFAEAFARGEPEAIECRWQGYLTSQAPHLLDLRAFLTLAGREPRLRALLPFTSHENLGFRRSVADRSSRALAWVRPCGADRYLVSGPDRRTNAPIGPADARESFASVLAVL